MKFNSQEEKKLATIMFKILEQLKNPNLVCNQKGIILFANKSYQTSMPNVLKNKPFWQAYPPNNEIPCYFTKATEQGIEVRSEIIFEEKSFIIHIIPVTNILVNDLLYIVYFEEITAQTNLNKQLQMDNNLIKKSFFDTILAFSDFVESRDAYTSGHQKRVALLSINIAAMAKVNDPKLINAIYYGALMHDIGKIAVPMEYLVTPRRLSKHEYEIIKTHVEIGNKIIEHMDFPWDIKSVVYQHHERMDGSGYPNGIKGEQITIPARIVAIADAYEAMSTDRPYRKLIPQQTILQYFKDNKGTLFDAFYVDCLFQCLTELNDVYEMTPNFRPFNIFDDN